MKFKFTYPGKSCLNMLGCELRKVLIHDLCLKTSSSVKAGEGLFRKRVISMIAKPSHLARPVVAVEVANHFLLAFHNFEEILQANRHRM